MYVSPALYLPYSCRDVSFLIFDISLKNQVNDGMFINSFRAIQKNINKNTTTDHETFSIVSNHYFAFVFSFGLITFSYSSDGKQFTSFSFHYTLSLSVCLFSSKIFYKFGSNII